MMEWPEQRRPRASTDKLERLWLTCDKGEEESWKGRRRLCGASGAICRHSAHSVPCTPVGHVKIAPSITPRSGQLEGREAKRQKNDGGEKTTLGSGPEDPSVNTGMQRSEALGESNLLSKHVNVCYLAYPNCLDVWME